MWRRVRGSAMSPTADAACFQRAAVVDRDTGLSVATRRIHPGGHKVPAASPGLARHEHAVGTLNGTATFHAATSGRLAGKTLRPRFRAVNLRVRLRAIGTSLLSNTVPSPSFCLATDLPVVFRERQGCRMARRGDPATESLWGGAGRCRDIGRHGFGAHRNRTKKPLNSIFQKYGLE